MARWSKHDYNMVAANMNRHLTRARAEGTLTEDKLRLIESVAQDFSDSFEADNDRFDAERFWTACGLDNVTD